MVQDAQDGKVAPDIEKRAIAKAKTLGTLECSFVGCTVLPDTVNGVLKSRLCSGCRTVRYCCAACQKADWKAHKMACKAIGD